MNRIERRAIAKEIAKLEKEQKNNDNDILENAEKIEQLIRNCSLEDLFEIDDLIMRKYLTN